MVLELITLILLASVLALKYGTVSRIVQMNQRLREAENKCRRFEEDLSHRRNEKIAVEKEETGLIRKQIALESHVQRTKDELEALESDNAEILQALTKKGGKVDWVAETD